MCLSIINYRSNVRRRQKDREKTFEVRKFALRLSRYIKSRCQLGYHCFAKSGRRYAKNLDRIQRDTRLHQENHERNARCLIHCCDGLSCLGRDVSPQFSEVKSAIQLRFFKCREQFDLQAITKRARSQKLGDLCML